MASGGGGGAAARMPGEAATELVRKGSMLLLLDVPQRTLFGIDTQERHTESERPGSISEKGPRSGNKFAPTVGFFLTTQPSEVIVQKWDAQEERLIKLSEEEEIGYSEAVRRFEFDDQLGPYNLDSFGDWKQLSSYLSQSAIERLERASLQRTLLCRLSGEAATTQADSVKHKNVSWGDLTALNLDKMGQSLEAFMQWKALVSLLLSCSEAPLHTRTNLFVKFLRTFYYQLKHRFQRTQDSRNEDVSNSLFLDEAWFSRDIFLYRLSKARKLKTLLETTFGWDLEDNAVNLIDDDEEANEVGFHGISGGYDLPTNPPENLSPTPEERIPSPGPAASAKNKTSTSTTGNVPPADHIIVPVVEHNTVVTPEEDPTFNETKNAVKNVETGTNPRAIGRCDEPIGCSFFISHDTSYAATTNLQPQGGTPMETSIFLTPSTTYHDIPYDLFIVQPHSRNKILHQAVCSNQTQEKRLVLKKSILHLPKTSLMMLSPNFRVYFNSSSRTYMFLCRIPNQSDPYSSRCKTYFLRIWYWL
ncbi:hypothetical protein C2845_PM15G01100 [Panicum miliaceum]|uniref:Uncharacterized protein n=1 Tax=Panicum miliaceum TaxID=4540 RepID=A0A3L6QB38_PANMI|nr:hypothetical protein C2845_PM15G01100 [Panicum miliaceum]